jgi:Ser/Thr protein kinase RdoA (MazF antagonist)
MQQLDKAIPEALSQIGGEVVSIHGDLHQGNTVLTANEVLLAIDFEFSCVSQVRQDLLYSSWESGANRRALCTAYLKARGLPSNQREVDLLAVDMIVAAVVHFRLLRELLSVGSPLPSSGIGIKQALSELSQLNRAVEVLKGSPERCAHVVDETDVWKCIKDTDLLLDLCTKY